jgi:pimeloyl-ACP methyl ester carboxylesterase
MTAAFTEHRYSAEDGLELYYRRYGDPLATKLPLLCLPGLTRNSKDYHALALRLSGERMVICPDYRGRGRSAYDADWRRYRPEIYVRDVNQLMILEALSRVVAVGTSLGGLLVMGLGVVRPAALAGVVLNDVGPDIHEEGLARILAYVGRDDPQPDWATAARELRRRLPLLGLDSEAKWLGLAERSYRRGEDGILHVDWDVNLARPLLLAGQPPADLWRLFHALRDVPMLALRGGQSDILTEATLARMIAARSDLRHVTLPGIGHVPALDERQSLEAIDEFLASIPDHG